MVIDSLSNASKYFALHPLFEEAFRWIGQQDLDGREDGKFDIDAPGLKAIFSNKKGMTKEESTGKFECHNQHIDIQLCIDGIETFGWKPRETCHSPKGGYNEEKDVQFYGDAPDMFFVLRNRQFAIFFPDDVHAPMIGNGSIRKLVIKVKIKP